jgi:hypothetical protein
LNQKFDKRGKLKSQGKEEDSIATDIMQVEQSSNGTTSQNLAELFPVPAIFDITECS